MFKLYTRDQFRQLCLERDRHRCLICQTAQDLAVHHILERRLFANGGCYLENGATLCDTHHLEAEATTLSCQQLREIIGIKTFPFPDNFCSNDNLDKWGNIILPDGKRLKGQLFTDKSVQKILQPILHLFVDYVKYPKTFHLPFSQNASNDDKILTNCDHFLNQEVVITIKYDGENTSLYRDHMHARSLNSDNHPSRDWVKNLHAQIKHEIPEGFRICGENLYAKHTLQYQNLKSYFYVFSIWDQHTCLSWKDTLEWCQLLGLEPIPVIYQGQFDLKYLQSLSLTNFNDDPIEGYVVRNINSFNYFDFSKNVAKNVFKTFQINSNHHWKHQQITPNQIKK